MAWMFSDEQIADLRQIYIDVFGEDISVDEANDIARYLMDVYEALQAFMPHLDPDTQAQLERLAQHHG